MNLIIDIGNTAIKTAIFDPEGKMVEELTADNDDLGKLDTLILRYKPSKGILSTVIPLNREMELKLQSLPLKLLRLNAQTPMPLTLRYRTPQTLGTDRIAVAVEAAAQQPGRDLLIIDSGTCITYEFVSAEGEYLGGNISPGIRMRLKALHAFTGKLPLVDRHGDIPEIGYDTETAIRSGVILGIKREIEGYIHDLKVKKPQLLVFLTGGNQLNFETNIKSGIFADRLLLLKGLNRILEYNDQ